MSKMHGQTHIEYSQSTPSKYLVYIYGVSSSSSKISYLTCPQPIKLSECFLNKFDRDLDSVVNTICYRSIEL